MNRLTTENPNGNFETAMNFVFDKDREAFIRHDGISDNVSLWKYIDRLCEERGCDIESPQGMWDEKITDSINYLLLLSALVKDMCGQEQVE